MHFDTKMYIYQNNALLLGKKQGHYLNYQSFYNNNHVINESFKAAQQCDKFVVLVTLVYIFHLLPKVNFQKKHFPLFNFRGSFRGG